MSLDSASLGLLLLITGMVFFLLVWGMPRLFSSSEVHRSNEKKLLAAPDSSANSNAILVVQSGGLVNYVSATARSWLDLHDGEQPTLESITRRIHPSDDFLKICNMEGQMRLSINGRPIDAVSYWVPGAVPSLLISLIPNSKLVQSEESKEILGSTLKILTDLSQSVAKSMDLVDTIQAILENVELLVSADVLEIKLWNPEVGTLTPYRLGLETGASRRIEVSSPQIPDGYSANLLEHQKPLFIPDSKNNKKSAIPNNEQVSLFAYLGHPLMVGNEFIGTLEVGLTRSGSFKQAEVDILQLAAGEAAAAIHSASMLEAERRRSAELSGLAKLAQALGSTNNARELFSRLVESVAPLFDVETLGFLVYNESKRSLEAQVPFFGMPEQFVELYHIPLPSGSSAETHFLKMEELRTKNAQEDKLWEELGLQEYAQAASWRDTALIPLISSGHPLGYLQVSNHRQPDMAFTQEELRMLNIVSNQAAPIIENLTLVQQARHRAQRSEALRRITSLSTTSATLDEILRYSVQELARLLQADTAAVYLVDETKGSLHLHKGSIFGAKPGFEDQFAHIYVDDAQYHFTVTGSLRPFLSGHLSEDPRLLSVYHPLFHAAGMESAVIAPLAIREQGLGEIIISSQKVDYFNNYDLQVITTASGQLASAIVGASIDTKSEDDVHRRVDQLMDLFHFSREINTTFEETYIVQVAYDESLRISGANCGSLLLLDSWDRGIEPKVMLCVGEDSAKTISPIERSALDNGDPVIVDDFDDEEFSSPHDDIRSALIMPVGYQDRIYGLLHLHATIPSFFTQAVVEIIQILAVQTAIAIENARRMGETISENNGARVRADGFSKLINNISLQSTDENLEESLQGLAEGLIDSIPFKSLAISLVDPATMLLTQKICLGKLTKPVTKVMDKQQWSSLEFLLQPENKIEDVYLVSSQAEPSTSVGENNVQESGQLEQLRPSIDPWDAVLCPFFDTSRTPLGLMSLEIPEDNRILKSDMLEVIIAFTRLISQTIENSRQLSAYDQNVKLLANSLKRQENLLSISQSHLPILLHKDLEQMTLINSLEERARRIRAGLAITEVINRQVDRNSALEALGREILAQLDMSVSVVAENTPDGPRLLFVQGDVPRETNPDALFGQRNPLRTSLQTGQILLSMDVEHDETWRDAPLLSNMLAKGFICLPILFEEKPVAGVLAINHETLPPLTEEDELTYFQISNQVSIILQNINLLTETRRRLLEVNLLLDFSRQLGGLDPDGIVKALLESALRVVKSAHAGVVFLYHQEEDLLKAHAASGYAGIEDIMEITYRSGEAIPGRVISSQKTERIDQVDFVRDYDLSADQLSRYRQATAGRLPISSLVLPVQTREKTLGVLLLDNFNTPSAFTSDDESLLLSLTQQVALSLENVRLVQASQERATQLQVLTDVSVELTSSLKFNELIENLLDRLGDMLQYDRATLWLRDSDRISVVSGRGFTDNEKRVEQTVSISDSPLMDEIIQSVHGLIVTDSRQDARFGKFLDPDYLSWLGIPLVSKGEVIGVIALEKSEANFFNLEMFQLVTTFSSQSAVAIENARLYEESLQRAAELDERSTRLALLNRISSELSGSLNVDQILKLTSRELRQALSVNKVSMITFDRSGTPLIRVVVPSNQKTQPRNMHKAPIFDRLRESLDVFFTEDIKKEPDLDPLRDMLVGIRSLLILPFVSGHNLHALAFVQDNEVRHFTEDEIDLARIICNQVSIALESAHLYQASISRAEQLSTINRASHEIGSSLDAEEIYAAIHQAASELMRAETFVISLVDEERGDIEGVYLLDPKGRSPNQRLSLGEGLSGQVIATGESLLIPDMRSAEAFSGKTFGEGEPRSIVAVPLMMRGKIIGMLSAQSYEPDVYTEEEKQILSTLANQAAIAIQNGRLFAETRRLADELEQRVVERTAELAREQRNTETLLRVLTEASSTLDLDRALNRILALLNDSVGAERGCIMMVNPEDKAIQYRAGYGYLAQAEDVDSKHTELKLSEELAGWVVKHHQPVRIDDIGNDARWSEIFLEASDHRNVIAAPLNVGEDVIGAILVFHHEIGHFTPDALNLVQAIGNQVAVAINNAQLFNLIHDQAEHLGSMLRSQQVDSSRQKAILEAVADGVLVTDPNNEITFINPSAERIMALDTSQIIGQSLDDFIGLFGNAAQTWMQTIRSWSDDPSNHEPGDTYAEQISLETGKVVLVHLAPVIWQNEFLGTVSIFRDITHEVEVDRLKSEFVATVSHELRTPMTSIKGYVDILLMGAAGALNENQTHFLEIVSSNTDRLTVLVNDLLDISRIEAGRVSLSIQAVDLREVVDELISDIHRRMQEENRPMNISIEADTELPRVSGDIERVRQILSNLLDNAYHYTPDDGKIIIRLRSVGDTVQVEVQDNGIGIDPGDADRIYERFFRGENPMVLATPGTGLGLAIVKQLVSMHKGRLWMTSKGIPGEGCTFYCTFPLHQIEEKSNGENFSS